MRQRIVFDMETGDPDDVFTLIWLLGHPGVDLQAVTITPGTPHQIGIVRHVLDQFGQGEMTVGAFDIHHRKARGTPEEHYVSCVSDWHYKFLGQVPCSENAIPGWQALHIHLDENTILLTGAPLKNLGALLRRPPPVPEFRFPWVAQGGFAGEGVVPEPMQLDKFKGMRTCPTYNLNGDPKSALLAMEHPLITTRRFVSKNVCHSVVYDQELHTRLERFLHGMSDLDTPHGLSLEMIYSGMGVYLAKRASGKAFHDPLAACCAINPAIGTWAKVKLFREKGGWGAEFAEPGDPLTSDIIVAYNRELFIQTLLGELP